MHYKKWKLLLLISLSAYNFSIPYNHNALPLIAIPATDIQESSLKIATSLLTQMTSMNEKGKTNVIFIGNLIYFFEGTSL